MSIKKIVLPSKSQQQQQINPFLYGIDELSSEEQISFEEIDRGFYVLKGFPQWNDFIAYCNLSLLSFIDEEFELIKMLVESTIATQEVINIVRNQDHWFLNIHIMYIEQF